MPRSSVKIFPDLAGYGGSSGLARNRPRSRAFARTTALAAFGLAVALTAIVIAAHDGIAGTAIVLGGWLALPAAWVASWRLQRKRPESDHD
jgi:hypothetical protein